MDALVEMADGQTKYVQLSQLPPAAVRAARHAASVQATKARAANGRNSGAAPPASIDDALSLAELADLQCQTHKLPPRLAKRRRVEVEAALGDVAEAGEPPVAGSEGLGSHPSPRSGGFLLACTSEGCIIDVQEFFGSESLPQRYFFVARLRKQLGADMRVLVHDDACHVRRFADKRAQTGAFARSLAHPALRYVVDRWHARNHVDAWCLANCHPDAPVVQGLLDGFKSSACETVNSWLSKYKH
eukprot:5626555-Lingulodinium_polyedra.AAC.1